VPAVEPNARHALEEHPTGAAGKVWRCTTGGAASSMASGTMPTRLKVGTEEAGNDRNAFYSAIE